MRRILAAGTVLVTGLFVVSVSASAQTLSSDTASRDVLLAPEACDMPVSEVERRLDLVRTPAERDEARKVRTAWPCYNPKPGHPTATERKAFIDRIAPIAQKAENDHGIPAAAIIAMAIIESGSGFTRTALEASNLFGWKWTRNNSRPRYVLACQDTTGERGDADQNRCYIAFPTEAAAIDYVASRLAAGFNPRYAAAHASFLKARITGNPVVERVQDWVVGIASPYNWRPAAYARDICRIMRDPIARTGNLNSETNLYKFSAGKGEDVTLQGLKAAHQDCESVGKQVVSR